jgi:hypothetical protein
MSVNDLARSPQRIVRSHFGKIVVTLAVAITASAITAPAALANSGCTNRSFSTSDEYPAQQCVLDEQVLLNDLYSDNANLGPNRWLATDGYYGPQTAADVAAFNLRWGSGGGLYAGDTFPSTWTDLCRLDSAWGWTGYYYHNADCPSVGG